MGQHGQVLPPHVPLQRGGGRAAEDDHHRQEEHPAAEENDHVVRHLVVYKINLIAIINSYTLYNDTINEYCKSFSIKNVFAKVPQYSAGQWLCCVSVMQTDWRQPRPLSPILPKSALSESWVENAADRTTRGRTGENVVRFF